MAGFLQADIRWEDGGHGRVSAGGSLTSVAGGQPGDLWGPISCGQMVARGGGPTRL